LLSISFSTLFIIRFVQEGKLNKETKA